MACRSVSRADLVDLLATGISLNAIARELGYHDHRGVSSAMQRLGIERAVSPEGVVTVIVRKVA